MPEKIFDNCQQNRFPEETDQQHMERILKEYLAKKVLTVVVYMIC